MTDQNTSINDSQKIKYQFLIQILVINMKYKLIPILLKFLTSLTVALEVVKSKDPFPIEVIKSAVLNCEFWLSLEKSEWLETLSHISNFILIFITKYKIRLDDQTDKQVERQLLVQTIELFFNEISKLTLVWVSLF